VSWMVRSSFVRLGVVDSETGPDAHLICQD
jgi:hypothetical protein